MQKKTTIFVHCAFTHLNIQSLPNQPCPASIRDELDTGHIWCDELFHKQNCKRSNWIQQICKNSGIGETIFVLKNIRQAKVESQLHVIFTKSFRKIMHSSYFAKLLAHDWLYGQYHVCHLYYSRYLVPFIFIMFFYIRLQKYLLFIKHYALYHSFFSCRANWRSDLLVSLLLEGTDLQDMF